LEVNIFHYPLGGLLGAHADLTDKIVTHVLYFNRSWNDKDGGCLTILQSPDPSDIVTTVSPVVGNSAVLVRSDNSWHAVAPVVKSCRLSRRSLTATFYHPGSVSTMWPPGDNTPLHHYSTNRLKRWWGKITQ
jgi:SM-20-related protein